MPTSIASKFSTFKSLKLKPFIKILHPSGSKGPSVSPAPPSLIHIESTPPLPTHSLSYTLSQPPAYTQSLPPAYTQTTAPSHSQIQSHPLPPTPNQGHSFIDTVRVVSRETQHGRYTDVVDAFFFTDRRCQNRAYFMAARLKQALWPTLCGLRGTDTFWQSIAHRLYTLNYLLFVLPYSSPLHSEAMKITHNELHVLGEKEVIFAIHSVLCSFPSTSSLYAIRHTIVREAQRVIACCLESESKLTQNEKDAMYLFHGHRMGLHGTFPLQIELAEASPALQKAVMQAMQENQARANTSFVVNPFEDEDANANANADV
ncbi:hypothetical protein BDF14DRAFT_1841575 [Spinellus fusiger]|nr:hypothetical protein BDF14DRAFT_1841575 [Spinellus fusiger]